jgi:hypothetical protein
MAFGVNRLVIKPVKEDMRGVEVFASFRWNFAHGIVEFRMHA